MHCPLFFENRKKERKKEREKERKGEMARELFPGQICHIGCATLGFFQMLGAIKSCFDG
jgi:hypothetical protein